MKVVALTLAILVCVICGYAYAQRGEIDLDIIWERNSMSVVRVVVSGKTVKDTPATRVGTGVVVSSRGDILTALHVVGDSRDWLIDPGNNLVRTIEVLGLDASGSTKRLGSASVYPIQSLDLAILHLTARNLAYANSATVRPSDTSKVVTIVWDKDATTPRTIPANLEPADRARFGDVLSLQMTVQDGHSGSPVFDADGNLAAIVTNKLSADRATAIPVDRIPRDILPAVNMKQDLQHGRLAKGDVGHASLRLEVRKKNDTPVRGVRLRVFGQTAGSSNDTTDTGQCLLPLPSGSRPAAVMTLEMDPTHSPSKEWYIVSPRRGRMVLPDPANELEFYIDVELAESLVASDAGQGPRSIDPFRKPINARDR